MNERPIIAVDAMGGDFGPSVVVPGAIEAARLYDLHVQLVGDTPKLEAELEKLDLTDVHFDIVHADDVVHMNEKPSDILRRKKNSSIQVACRQVKDGAADAVVSAGHSGATVACGMFIMGRLPGVERPLLPPCCPRKKTPWSCWMWEQTLIAAPTICSSLVLWAMHLPGICWAMPLRA